MTKTDTGAISADRNALLKIAACVMLICIAVALSSCGVDPRKATAALEAQGMTDVKIGGYSWFGCAKGDEYHSSFSATGANGKPVTGVVCSGMFKGTTVRFD